MKKKYLLLLLIIPVVLLSGCNKTVEKTTICKKTLPYNDTQIDWKNEIEIKEVSGAVEDITVREIITVDPSVNEERIVSFRDKVQVECTGGIGEKFDSCNLEEKDRVFTLVLKTKKLDILDSAITSSNEQALNPAATGKEVIEYLQNMKYTCEEA